MQEALHHHVCIEDFRVLGKAGAIAILVPLPIALSMALQTSAHLHSAAKSLHSACQCEGTDYLGDGAVAAIAG